MTLIYLLRHAHSTANAKGVLAGQLPDIALSEIGLKQAEKIAKKFEDSDISAIYTSPLLRCHQSIQPFLDQSHKKKIPVYEDFGIIEMDYGLWSGKKLRSLSKFPLWLRIQRKPSAVTFPAGESFISMQKRSRRSLLAIAKKHPRGKILLVSHGDVIKVMVTSLLGLPLDNFQKIVIDPASVTVVDISAKKSQIIHLNLPIAGLRFEKKRSRLSLGGGSHV